MYKLFVVQAFICLLFSGSVHAQDATRKKIVVLPFRVATTGLKQNSRDGFQQLKAYEMEQGLLMQQAFYNALTEEGHHLDLEDIAVTNAHLKAAGIELSKAYWMDKATLCKLLNANAVIAGTLQEAKISSRARLDADLGGSHFNSDRNEKRIVLLQLFEHTSGEMLVDLKHTGTLDAILSEDGKTLARGLTGKIYKQMSHYVPVL